MRGADHLDVAPPQDVAQGGGALHPDVHLVRPPALALALALALAGGGLGWARLLLRTPIPFALPLPGDQLETPVGRGGQAGGVVVQPTVPARETGQA